MIKILFLSPYLVYPGALGGTQRLYSFIRHLSSRHRLFLVHFAEGHELDRLDEAAGMKDLCVHAEVFPRRRAGPATRLRRLLSPSPNAALHYRDRRVEALVDEIVVGREIDIIHVEYGWMAGYVRSAGRAAVLCEQEVASRALREASQAGAPALARVRGALHAWKYRRYERRMTGLFDRVFVTTAEERAALEGCETASPIGIYPNVVDTDRFRSDAGPTSPPSILFIGNFRHAPNVEGLRWFLDNAYPRIRQEAQEVRLTIVGPAIPDDLARSAREAGATLSGFVPDIRPYLEECSIFVCPVVTGGGMRGKILEAMAMARPVVTTARGAEGIEAAGGILFADEPGDFAAAVVRLVRDPDLCMEMGRGARRLVAARYDMKLVFPEMERRYEELVRGRR